MMASRRVGWLARAVLFAVFFFNVNCALEFIVRPFAYAPSFEVDGVAGEALVRGMGILFLMWNATYPLPMWDPWRFRRMFAVVVIQQAIGLAGETWMLLALPAGHPDLARTALRFIAFDGGGLVAFLVVFLLMLWTARRVSGMQRELND